MPGAELSGAVPTPPARPLALQEIAVCMRYSFFGMSGWQSGFSKQKELLFDPARLGHRLALLKSVALASLQGQTDRAFHLFVLTSEDLPDLALRQLTDACEESLGSRSVTIAPKPPGRARKHLREFLARRYAGGRSVQVVLDDDDGLATDYMATLRALLAELDGDAAIDSSRPYFLSFANGYGLVFEPGQTGAPALFRHRYPHINLGLAMIGRADGENLFSIDHLAAPRKYGSRIVSGAPMWVRSVHGLNDSRVAVTDRWTPVPDWRDDAEVLARFPFLRRLGLG